ncbi:response regulator [Qipengyuania sp. GH25]|uniref:Response regulator n=1 Tax=Qipengyuania pacifica TaxID=2860199 RepID=A0ABS7JK74_9SPHN|nr:response regulator [Qipengyuania aerophila]MBX7489799.1 response regulator [Qipengyuania aerophila]
MTSPAQVLILDGDPCFRAKLENDFRSSGYLVTHAQSLPEPVDRHLDYAVINVKLGTGSGLTALARILGSSPDTTVVMISSFASIALAVECIKMGATDFLLKPCTGDEIEAAFFEIGRPAIAGSSRPVTIKTLEWESINRTLAETKFNISETARRLGMHRRTLARKLAKRLVN